MGDTTRPTRRDVIVGAAAVAGTLLTSRGDAEAGVQGATPARGPSGPFANVKVLVFDTFGTVVDWRSVVIEEGTALSRAKGLRVDWPAFADEWRGAYGPSMNRVRTGELPWTKLDVLHRMSLDALLAKHQVTQLSEADKAQFNRVWHRGRPWPDSVRGLTRLKAHYVIAPLSNGNLGLLTNMAKHGGLPWDCILGAELVRHYKPDPETYLSPVQFFDLTPPEVMMVAAHPGDLQSARALGLRTAYVHRPLENGTPEKARMPAAGSFDIQVQDFLELASALGA
ncbi:MAG TPA: haloacid dehalogenase type II [Vicinamibacterales bacterium]|nr:haloacid dehalogenase type II [Vicinamibacterales bacterium]